MIQAAIPTEAKQEPHGSVSVRRARDLRSSRPECWFWNLFRDFFGACLLRQRAMPTGRARSFCKIRVSFLVSERFSFPWRAGDRRCSVLGSTVTARGDMGTGNRDEADETEEADEADEADEATPLIKQTTSNRKVGKKHKTTLPPVNFRG